ncbi:unnamed protein product [Bursaphelenchus okinawaensis]|uniref:CBM21 domain-containing protein n=1 Tax=Bursaphelenchus okinawaensis TaxID=465554 RepID=A0A811KMR7_9BILA|nr:unnamed protein product [Bursaphelenchus okinawaensis]CAG9105420.1 unnamed protein product [Bursaphelenchus okinawaensis]
MGMECVQTSALKYWAPQSFAQRRWLDDTAQASSPPLDIESHVEDEFTPHSAPSTCTLLSSACRRAASFPLANMAFLGCNLQARSQSESAALNRVSVKMPRTLLQEFHYFNQRQQEAQKIWNGPSLPGGVKFYAPVHEDGGSESDTEEGRMSSSPSSSSDEDDVQTTPTSQQVPLLLLNNQPAPAICSDDIVRHLELTLENTKVDEHGQSDKTSKVISDECTNSSTSSETSHLLHEETSASASDSEAKSSSSQTTPTNTHRRKHLRAHRHASRAVRFADECGNELYELKVLTEPSDYPPEIPRAVIQRHRKAAGLSDLSDEEGSKPKPKSTWKVMFKQPASEYFKFKQSLEANHVALENVIVKNEVPKVVGTIKVGNIAFEKRVFLRCTADRWKSFQDYDAKFLTSASKNFDTFTFDIPLPNNIGQANSHYEFCLCYCAGKDQYWDSNDGKNFILDGECSLPPASPPARVPSPKPQTNAKIPAAKLRAAYNDAYRMEYRNWSSFASWKELSTDEPYW